MKIKILFVLLFIFVLISCEKKIYYDLETLEKDVISAEIVEMQGYGSESVRFSILNSIEENKLNDILNDLSEIEFICKSGNPRSPEGLGLKLNYNDGYEIICSDLILKFDNSDKWISVNDIYQPDEFEELILKYRTY